MRRPDAFVLFCVTAVAGVMLFAVGWFAFMVSVANRDIERRVAHEAAFDVARIGSGTVASIGTDRIVAIECGSFESRIRLASGRSILIRSYKGHTVYLETPR